MKAAVRALCFGAGFALGALACLGGAFAQTTEPFYKGKQIRLIVGTGSGGSYDLYARILSRYMGDHIPGNPNIVVQNMPGAAGIKAANYIYSVAPRDGTVICANFSGIPVAPLIVPGEAQYDVHKLQWIGSATKELYVGYVRSAAPALSMEAIKTTQVIMGGSSVGTYSVDMGLIANAFFDTKFKIVTGYTSGSETQLALDRGEVDGVMATAWGSLKQKGAQWIAQGKIRVIVQYGEQRDPQFPDVPSFIEFAQSDAQRQAIRFETARLDHGKPYFAPPDVPADRIAILRRAFDETMKDAAFLKDIVAANIEIDGPMSGEVLQRSVEAQASTPPAVVKSIVDILARFKGEAPWRVYRFRIINTNRRAKCPPLSPR